MILLPKRFAVRLYGDHRQDAPDEQLFAGFGAANKAYRCVSKGIIEGREYGLVEVRREDVAARLSLEIDFPDREQVVWMECRALSRGSDIVWGGKWIDDELPRTTRVMPDFIYAYAWDERDREVHVDDTWPNLAGAVELGQAFAEWQLRFERAEWEPNMPMLPGFDWNDFHRDGMELAIQLKTLIGDRCEVLYEKPYEDPQRHIEEFRLVV